MRSAPWLGLGFYECERLNNEKNSLCTFTLTARYLVFFITKMGGRWRGFLLCFGFPLGEAGGQRGGRDEGLPAVRDHQAAEPGLHPRDQRPHLHHRLHRHHERTGEPVAGQSYPDREAGAVLFLKQNLILVKLFQLFFFQGLFFSASLAISSHYILSENASPG